jgi:hypothetical protein
MAAGSLPRQQCFTRVRVVYPQSILSYEAGRREVGFDVSAVQIDNLRKNMSSWFMRHWEGLARMGCLRPRYMDFEIGVMGARFGLVDPDRACTAIPVPVAA